MNALAQQPVLSRLESLPGELRNRIYRYAVVEEKPVQAAGVAHMMDHITRSIQPALAATNRQLRREVLPIFYGENTFIFEPQSSDSINRYNQVTRQWWAKLGQYQQFIEKVGSRFFASVLGPGNRVSSECFIIATKSTSGNTIKLGSGLEGQCECDLRWREARLPPVGHPDRLDYAMAICCQEAMLYMRRRPG